MNLFSNSLFDRYRERKKTQIDKSSDRERERERERELVSGGDRESE